MEIERLKEELRQQKDREDRARRLINQKLKQKTDDFDRLHRDYKHLDADHKKLTTESDRQQEKCRELREEVNQLTAAVMEEQSKGAEVAKQLAAAAKERLDLQVQHHAETERATMALNRVQTTYQTQLMHYRSQEVATASLIKQLKDEKQAAENKSKMGLGRIRDIVLAWRNRTKQLVEESSVQWWSKWAK